MLIRYTAKYVLLIASIVCLLPVGLDAQSEELRHDVGSWITITASGRLGADDSRFTWGGLGQMRAVENSAGYHTAVVSAVLGYLVASGTTVRLAGSVYHVHPKNVDDFLERRLTQELTWSRSGSPISVTLRGRVEERFFTTGSDMGIRLRARLQLRSPLSDDGRFGILGSQEFFINANDTDWGAASGYRQNRIYLGFYWDLGERTLARLTVGYLNQLGIAKDRADLMNHLLSVQAAFRL